MRTVTEQARDAFASDSCVIDGNLKVGRRDWFCRGCTARLDPAILRALHYHNRDWKEKFVEALQILAEEKIDKS